jgi:hypothetical protein
MLAPVIKVRHAAGVCQHTTLAGVTKRRPPLARRPCVQPTGATQEPHASAALRSTETRRPPQPNPNRRRSRRQRRSPWRQARSETLFDTSSPLRHCQIPRFSSSDLPQTIARLRGYVIAGNRGPRYSGTIRRKRGSSRRLIRGRGSDVELSDRVPDLADPW